MQFDLAAWKKAAALKVLGVRDWVNRLAGEKVPYVVYGTVGGLTLWPLIEATKTGQLVPVVLALGSAAAGVGGNLIAEQIQRWADRTSKVDEAEVIRWVVENTADKDILAALDAILQKVETLEQGKAQLSQADRQWFVGMLKQEMQRLGNLGCFEAVLVGSGAIAQGKGAMAVGERGVLVRGNVKGSVIATDKVEVHIARGEAKRVSGKEALRKYREYVVENCGHLPMRGMDIGASDPTSGRQRVDLAQVYIGLNTKTPVPGKKGKRSKEGLRVPGEEETRPLTALEAAVLNRRMVLLGDPGSGKTTFVNHLAFCLAAHGLEPGKGWPGRIAGWPEKEAELVPVPVRLKSFAGMAAGKRVKAEPKDLREFIVSRLESQNLAFAIDPIDAALDRGEAILLLDGLDEIQDKSDQGFVRDAILAFGNRYKKNRMVVTCRVLSYQEKSAQLEGVPTFELAPFDGEMMDAFIRAWYSELERLGVTKSPEEAEGMTRRLQEAVRRPDIRRLAPNPLLLTVMALVHTHKGKLPDARAMLYEDAVDILLWRWDQIKAAGEEAPPRLTELLQTACRAEVDLKRVLGRLAFEAQREEGASQREALSDIKEWQLQKALAELHPEKSLDWTAQLIKTIKLRAGLLIEREPGVYTFPHRTFQEFLAGTHLSNEADFPMLAARLAGEGVFWREVILLAVGRLVYLSGDISRPLVLVSELCPRGAKESEIEWRKVWLAGEVLIEIGTQRARESSLGRDLLERVPGQLVELLRAGALSPLERAAAGNTLVRLGDPRFDPGMWFLPRDERLGFVEVPEGRSWMGSDKEKDPGAFDDEMPRHQVALGTYYIGKYPVTVAQFKVFVEKSGHKPTDENCLKGTDNHPVVYVTWYDALAYCKWLTERFRETESIPEWIKTLIEKNWIIRLPTEAEWEKAARGTDGRIYPWGNEPDTDRTNCDETGIGATSAVECFPKGASPYGVQDMSGSVWEWTQSQGGKDLEKPEFKYPYDPTDGRENLSAGLDILRVLRGGSFFDFQGAVRCAQRDWYYPDYWDRDFGFRVVLAPDLPSVL